MIKEIVKDQFVLSQKSSDADKDDEDVIKNLKDTIIFHKEHCVGMAANMIGVCKNIIVFYDQNQLVIMINPVLLKQEHPYETKESCLCHTGDKQTKRYKSIKVAYQDENFKKKIKSYQGLSAQIIQHEMDHLMGILI